MGVLITFFVINTYSKSNEDCKNTGVPMDDVSEINHIVKDIDTINSISYVINDSISDYYKDYPKQIPEDGIIPNERVAVKVAAAILKEINNGEKNQIKSVTIALDDNKWKIKGRIKKNQDERTFYIELDKKSGSFNRICIGL